MSYGTSPLAKKWWEQHGEKEYDGKEPHEKSAEEYAGQYLYFHPENALELFQRDYAHLEEILFNEITDLIQKETEKEILPLTTHLVEPVSLSEIPEKKKGMMLLVRVKNRWYSSKEWVYKQREKILYLKEKHCSWIIQKDQIAFLYVMKECE